MVLGLKPTGKLITLDKYLSAGQNKGTVLEEINYFKYLLRRFIKAPMNARLVYQSDSRRSIKVLMTARLVHRNARSVPWAGEEALALTGNKNRSAVT